MEVEKIEDSVEKKPLRAMGDAFDKLSSNVNMNEEIKVCQFSEAASKLSDLFGCLGVAFKFAEVDYNAKVQDLMDASKSFQTLKDLLDYDVKRRCVKKAGSHARNFLRVKQGIEMVKVLFKQILSTEENSLREPASIAYSLVLAPTHGWALRKTVSAGMYSIPTRAQLFKRLNEDEKSACAQMQRFIEASSPVVEHINNLFLARNIAIEW